MSTLAPAQVRNSGPGALSPKTHTEAAESLSPERGTSMNQPSNPAQIGIRERETEAPAPKVYRRPDWENGRVATRAEMEDKSIVLAHFFHNPQTALMESMVNGARSVAMCGESWLMKPRDLIAERMKNIPEDAEVIDVPVVLCRRCYLVHSALKADEV